MPDDTRNGDAPAWSLRRTLGWSRHRAAEVLKTLIVVLPLTILIWIYAERSQMTEDTYQVSIELIPADPSLAAEVVEPVNSPLVLELKGPRNQINQFKDDLSRRSAGGPITVTLQAGYEPGDVTIDAAPLLNSDTTFNNFGISITKVTPAILKVKLDRYVDRELTVVMPSNLPAPLQQVLFEPAKVTARGPESSMDTYFPQPNPRIAVDLSKYAATMRVQGPHREEGVPLSVPDDKRIVLRPQTVTASFEVAASERETTIQKVTIAIQQPFAQVGKWVVKVHRAPVVQNVRLRGPSSALARYESSVVNGQPRDPELNPTAVLRVQPDDIGRSEVRRPVEFTDLLPGISVVGGPYEVEFHLEQVAPGAIP